MIAGAAHGLKSPVVVRLPLFHLHVALQPAAELALPKGYAELAASVARGRVEVEGRIRDAAQLLVFGGADDPAIRALDTATLMLLGGEALGARHIWWNFVSSRKERIEQAKADGQAGRIKRPPNDYREFIPLPEQSRDSTPLRVRQGNRAALQCIACRRRPSARRSSCLTGKSSSASGAITSSALCRA